MFAPNIIFYGQKLSLLFNIFLVEQVNGIFTVLSISKYIYIFYYYFRLDSTYEEFNPMDGRLDRAKIKYGGRFLDSDVDDVKVLVSLLPTLLFLIIYCSCYYQVCLYFVVIKRIIKKNYLRDR